MKTDPPKKMFLLPLFFVFFFAGCSVLQRPRQTTHPDEPEETGQSDIVAKRFQTGEQKVSAIDSAIELSAKYAKLSKEASELRVKNNDLVIENKSLKIQHSDIESKLKQAQKELTEANDLLIKMRLELNNWKVDVLGFRDEMREAEKAQLEALHKILVVLGGEVKSPSEQPGDTSAKSTSQAESQNSQTKNSSGQSNE